LAMERAVHSLPLAPASMPVSSTRRFRRSVSSTETPAASRSPLLPSSPK
jgi:hypothetical protein